MKIRINNKNPAYTKIWGRILLFIDLFFARLAISQLIFFWKISSGLSILRVKSSSSLKVSILLSYYLYCSMLFSTSYSSYSLFFSLFLLIKYINFISKLCIIFYIKNLKIIHSFIHSFLELIFFIISVVEIEL